MTLNIHMVFSFPWYDQDLSMEAFPLAEKLQPPQFKNHWCGLNTK